MKVLVTFGDAREARMAKDRLAASGIHAEIIGAREYSSIVTGGEGRGRYELRVDEQHFDAADGLLKEINKKTRLVNVNAESEDDNAPLPNYFRRAVFFALAAITLLPPGLSNYASLSNARKYWQHSTQDWRARARITFILFMQIPSLVALWAVYRAVTTR